MTDTLTTAHESAFDLKVPTELEIYQHQCLMRVDERHEAWAARRLKGDPRTLGAMIDAPQAELNG